MNYWPRADHVNFSLSGRYVTVTLVICWPTEESLLNLNLCWCDFMMTHRHYKVNDSDRHLTTRVQHCGNMSGQTFRRAANKQTTTVDVFYLQRTLLWNKATDAVTWCKCYFLLVTLWWRILWFSFVFVLIVWCLFVFYLGSCWRKVFFYFHVNLKVWISLPDNQ